MKQKIYILGLLAAMIVVTGIFFKVNHWPGAGVLITCGMCSMIFLFIPVALVNNYRASDRQNLSLYIVTYITCFVVFGGMLFKIMHWPYAGYFLFVALPFPFVIFLPFFLAATSKIKNHNIYDTVLVLFLLVAISVLSALLSLNVSRERIFNSYDLSRKYNRLEVVLNDIQTNNVNLTERTAPSPVLLKINALLKIADDYQNLILQKEGITKEQWIKNPELLKRPDERQVAAADLKQENETFPGEKLEAGLKDLIKQLNDTPGYQDLAKSAPLIFDYWQPGIDENPWAYSILVDNPLSWVLIYLDGLETNLLMIKTTLSL
jgi:hypothetical protein